MNIAYGTYGLPNLPMEQAVPRLAAMGYDSVELCIGEGYPTAPLSLTPDKRRRLRQVLDDHELRPCALMMLDPVMADGAGHGANLRTLGEACMLAHDLGVAAPAVVTATIGGRPDAWERERPTLVSRLAEWAAVAEREGCVVAIEPHVGGLVDRPERAAWALAELASPALALNLDVSHFDVQGYTTKYAVSLLAPLAVHAHVKDGRRADDGVHFLLPGAGDFDYVTYLGWMERAGYDGPITVEISRQVWSCADYDPFAAALFAYETLAGAFERAGIARPRP